MYEYPRVNVEVLGRGDRSRTSGGRRRRLRGPTPRWSAKGGKLVLVNLELDQRDVLERDSAFPATSSDRWRQDRRSGFDDDILEVHLPGQVDEHYQKQLFESALRDGLTATFNRRYFVDRLHTEMRFAVRHSKSLGLLFVDIDHFKNLTTPTAIRLATPC